METDQSYDHLADEDLVAEIVRSRNALLFGVLYDRYAQRIYNKCYGFARSEAEAQDLTQDVFLHLFLKLPSFKGRSRFSTWVYSLTYNFCVNYVNRDKHRKMADKQVREAEIGDEAAYPEVDEAEILQMRSDKLARAMAALEADDRAILLLKYQDEASVKDIQELMDLGESAVKMRLKRARAKLVEQYRKLP
ncbi:sigma-70 family RNA polymerase sigma factor [Robiginitalea sp. M366]|uniref:RNA polymerase sigma factor n=1 Tax=Robiginitalea aestuariiviva TaxID=3036903 RepID=UPI00240D7EDB|nr:sigma-70 family RNA polymerase sigma factor [Robiginitalea aestuariiviva]MDG1570776.1 sigma-70 family RNA polymerase sigma factor [Robiginitalea aestuariiviva]